MFHPSQSSPLIPRPSIARCILLMAVSLVCSTLAWSEDWTGAGPTVPQSAEISIMGIRLADPESSKKMLGPDIETLEQDGGFPSAHYLSSDGKEWLTLVTHNGDVVNSFNEMRIELAGPKTPAKAQKLPEVLHFVTGKGVQLGATLAEVQEKLGKGTLTKESGKEVLAYAIVDEKSPFLKSFGMPSYYGRYTFKEGKLISIAFGFEYP